MNDVKDDLKLHHVHAKRLDKICIMYTKVLERRHEVVVRYGQFWKRSFDNN